MLGSIAQDSKRRERYIKVLAGCRKQNGTICVLIENSTGEKYRVTLYGNGVTFSCRHEVNGKHECCPSRGRCYHIQAVLKIASLFTEEGYLAKEQAPREMQYYYHDETESAAAAGDKSYGEALAQAYEQLATTKRVSIAGSLSSRGLMRGQRTTYCGGQRIA